MKDEKQCLYTSLTLQSKRATIYYVNAVNLKFNEGYTIDFQRMV